MIRTIHLHGGIGRRFGKQFDLHVDTPAEAIRALCHMLTGFREALSMGAYRVVRGRLGVPVDGLAIRLGKETELHILPAAAGAKNAGVGKIIAGVVLIAAAALTYGAAAGAFGSGLAGFVGAGAGASASAIGITGIATVAQLGFMGVGMVLAGASMLLAPQPRSQGPLTVDQNPSFMFSGPVNTYAQGGPVPLIYGNCRVGSVVGAAALKAEDYVANPAIEPVTVPGKIAAAQVYRDNGWPGF